MGVFNLFSLTKLVRITAACTVMLMIASCSADIVSHPSKLTFKTSRSFSIQDSLHEFTEEGVKVFFIKDETTPIVNLKILLPYGQANDLHDKLGISDLFSSALIGSGAGDFSADEVDAKLSGLSANLRTGLGRHFSTLEMDTPAVQFAHSLMLLHTIMTQPKFDQSRLQLYKNIAVKKVANRYNSLSSILGIENKKLLYGDDFFINKMPTKASIGSITQADLKSFYISHMNPRAMAIALSGNLTLQQVKHAVHRLFNNWPAVDQTLRVDNFQSLRKKSGVYTYHKEGDEPASIVLTLPGLPAVMDDSSYDYNLLVMNEILGAGSFSSRLMSVLREEEGLTYGVHSYFTQPRYYPGVIAVQLQTAPTDVIASLKLLVKQLQKIAHERVTPYELNIAKAGLAARFYAAIETSNGRLHYVLDRYIAGRPPSFLNDYVQRINAVTVAGVNAAAKQYLGLTKSIIVVAGDIDEINFAENFPNKRIEKLNSVTR
jgi:zinc protease